jgi:hypothetical protein
MWVADYTVMPADLSGESSSLAVNLQVIMQCFDQCGKVVILVRQLRSVGCGLSAVREILPHIL